MYFTKIFIFIKQRYTYSSNSYKKEIVFIDHKFSYTLINPSQKRSLNTFPSIIVLSYFVSFNQIACPNKRQGIN